ncbi:MAG: hypothetical protein HOO96_06600 [Polyangiaceae bacterium]|nr:hypothetical protein [Polyangiaceae bacterium]
MSDHELLELLRKGGSLAIPYLDGARVRVEPADIPVDLALPALRSFLARTPDERLADGRHLVAYCASTVDAVGEEILEDLPGGALPTLDTVWTLVRPRSIFFGMLEAGKYAPIDTAYVQMEAEVAWEPEHGLQLSWEAGRHLVKAGPFDGHPTNGHAYAKPEKDRFVFLGGSPEESTLPDPR